MKNLISALFIIFSFNVFSQGEQPPKKEIKEDVNLIQVENIAENPYERRSQLSDEEMISMAVSQINKKKKGKGNDITINGYILVNLMKKIENNQDLFGEDEQKKEEAITEVAKDLTEEEQRWLKIHFQKEINEIENENKLHEKFKIERRYSRKLWMSRTLLKVS